MKNYLFLLFLCLAIPVFSQDKDKPYRRISGLILNQQEKPVVAGVKICLWDERGREIKTEISCARTLADGSFILDVQKWEGRFYTIKSADTSGLSTETHSFENAEYFNRDISDVQITDAEGTNDLTVSEIRFQLKTDSSNIVNDLSEPINYGSVEVCRIDEPTTCESASDKISLQDKKFEFIAPNSAYTVKIKMQSDNQWIEWLLDEKNSGKGKTLQINLSIRNVSIQVLTRRTNRYLPQ